MSIIIATEEASKRSVNPRSQGSMGEKVNKYKPMGILFFGWIVAPLENSRKGQQGQAFSIVIDTFGNHY